MSSRSTATPAQEFIEAGEPRPLAEIVPAVRRTAAVARSGWIKTAGALLFLLALVIYVLRLDRVAGLFVDDGWYLMLAQALATGHGYSLINSPSPGILPLYPPGYPFLLSVLYRLYPHFPENVWLFKALSIVAMLGAGLLVFRYFVQVRKTTPQTALGLVAVTLLCPSLVMLVTSSVMSEAVFTCNLLAVIYVIERGVQLVRRGGNPLRYLLAGAVLAAFSFLVRSIAVSLIAAVVVYLFKERLWRQALLFSATVVLLVAPWFIYTKLHAPTPAQRAEQGGHITLSYTTQFWQKRASVPELGTIGVSGLPARVWWNVQDIVGRDIGRILATPIFEALIDPYQEARKEEVKFGLSHGSNWIFSYVLSLFVLLGFIVAARERVGLAEVVVVFSLGITTLWPWETYRFVLPLVAFIAFYFVLGVRWLVQLMAARLIRRAAKEGQFEGATTDWKLMTSMAVLLAVISLTGHVRYILNSYSTSPLERPQWLQIFEEAETMLAWIKRTLPRDGIITTSNPPLVYLYTDNKTVALDQPAKSWENWNRVGVRYMVQTSIYPEPIDPAERQYKTVYRSRSGMSFRVLDLGDPLNRPVWGAPAPLGQP
jgi:hypothetical protein